MSSRTVRRQHPAIRDDIGDLVTRRPLPGPGLPHLDPFLFLNHHGPQTYEPGNHGLPFGPHPHRGFETVTFILAGELAHLDSGGHESVIRPGGVQWMTAGAGLIHAELSPASFKQAGGPLEILQLWVNLPARLKMTAPRYTGLQADGIPVVAAPDGRAKVHLVSGRYEDVVGPIASETGISLLWATLKAGGSVTLPAPQDHAIFLYVVSGTASIGGESLRAHHLIELSDESDAVTIDAAGDAVILYGHAAPFGEPIVAHGPFVMNSREEIVQAVQDFQAGRFGAMPDAH